MLKDKKTIILFIFFILLVIVGGIYFTSFKKEDKNIYYSGNNDIADIKIVGYKDYYEFYENIPSSYILYDDKKEFSKKDYGFVGEIKFSSDNFNKESNYCLNIITKNGQSYNLVLLAIDKESENGIVTIPFIFYNFLDSNGKTIDKAVLTKDGDEITSIDIIKN
ncbi:hypothetical protein [Clostridium sp.]|uniref:hypothetical protein n=1 Tax=Clostridium sp. TaxID=1506 RepID=UPI0029022AEE|nr:hypothetical protein [Clostridium sp.]MBS7131327.1 hypothetical protein [Clostridium sp.]MDU2283403.1 hypothetical protein [Clostridium sp.]